MFIVSLQCTYFIGVTMIRPVLPPSVCDTSTGQQVMASTILFWPVHSVIYSPWWLEQNLVSQSAICFKTNTNVNEKATYCFYFHNLLKECTIILHYIYSIHISVFPCWNVLNRTFTRPTWHWPVTFRFGWYIWPSTSPHWPEHHETMTMTMNEWQWISLFQ